MTAPTSHRPSTPQTVSDQVPGSPSPTPSQTVGPYLSLGMSWLAAPDLVVPSTPGALTVHGQVLDADGVPVPDAVVEWWQADVEGRFPPATAPGWRGWGRCPTDVDGYYHLTTLRPGTVDGYQAPHANLSVFMRGLLQRLVTRVYFPSVPADAETPGSAGALDRDRVLGTVPAERRHTLVAQVEGDRLRFDVHLGGPDETVFFVW